MRGRKEKTIQNIEMRRKAETKLEEGLDWLEFLKIVSYTNVPLTQDLEQQYTENGNEVYEGEDLDFDENDDGEGTCINCQLKIYEKNMLQPCGDTNLCQDCIDDIMKSFPENPKCPNNDCSMTIQKVLPFRK